MSRNRRTFLKEAALTGVVACAVPVHSADGTDDATGQRCPYFDQPLTCGGPDEHGVYRCDA